MKRFLLILLLGAAHLYAACTASVTSPTAASTQSGVVNWTASISGCPTGFQTQWILDDFYAAGLGDSGTGQLTGFNTGTVLDGPFNVKVTVRDAKGAALVTSADVAFVIQNFGLGTTISISSLTSASGDVTATYNQNPTVSGTLSFDWRTSHSPSTNIVRVSFSFDSQQIPTDQSLPPHTSFDTTQLTNGTHLLFSVGYCVQGDSTCGGPLGGPIPRVFIAFTVNVQNGTALRGVQPNVENVTMTVGQTYTLSPVLAQTDGTTTSGTFDYTLNFVCNLAEHTQTQLPFLCVTGNTFPATSAQGAAYISLSCTSSCASPVTVTANALGLTFVTITDHASGKFMSIEVDVRDTLAIRHFGKCGTIYTSYTPTGSCPSVFRTSIENAGFGTDTVFINDYVKDGYTAFEGQFYQVPNNGTTNYPNFATWLNVANTTEFNPIAGLMSSMPGLCMVLRGENYTQHPQDSIEAQQGASAFWLPTDPLLYSLQTLTASKLICGSEQRDEADQGLGENPVVSMKFSDNSLSKLVCKSQVCMAYTGTGVYPASTIDAFGPRIGSGSTFIRNANATALNGTNTTNCTYKDDWDFWFNNTSFCTDPATGNPVSDSYTFNNPRGVADGTYTSATDPNLEILAYGSYVGYANTGSKQELNSNYQYVAGKFRTAGVPQTWPVLGSTGFRSNLYYFGNTMSDYMTLFQSYGGGTDQASGTGLPWGLGFWQYYSSDLFKKWGGFPGLGNLSVHRNDSKGWQTGGSGNQYGSHNQKVPVVGFVAMSLMTYNMGGINNTITGMSGSTLTTAAPHNVPTPGSWMGTNYIKMTITGNSDSAMNGHWNGYPIGSSTLRLYSPSPGGPVCTPSASTETFTFRGVTYTVDNTTKGGFSQITFTPNMPTDSTPGELATFHYPGSSCDGVVQAFWGFQVLSPPSYSDANFSPLANSTGTGGVAAINSEQGVFNPLYGDAQQFSQRMESLSAQAIYLAAQGHAGIRAYQSGSVGSRSTWLISWPNDNSPLGYQESPIPYTNVQAVLQQPWWQMGVGMNILNHRSSLFLTNKGPAPWISPGPPYVVSECTTSATYGNTCVVWNISEISQTVSVPLGTFVQIGTNPISVYTIAWPHSTSTQLTGAQTNYSVTMDPGEMDIFHGEPSVSGFVQPVSISFSPPGGTVTTSARFVYGNYSQPLASYTRVGVTGGATSPISVPLDTSASDTWYQLCYLDGSSNLISCDSLTKIPFVPPGVSSITGQVTISGSVKIQ